MRELLRDVDGDVWEHEGDDRWHLSGEPILTREEIESAHGPVVPLTETVVDDVRALVVAAFDDFAHRMAATWNAGSGEFNPFERCARETAEAVRSGELKVGGSAD